MVLAVLNEVSKMVRYLEEISKPRALWSHKAVDHMT